MSLQFLSVVMATYESSLRPTFPAFLYSFSVLLFRGFLWGITPMQKKLKWQKAACACLLHTLLHLVLMKLNFRLATVQQNNFIYNNVGEN